MSSIPEPPATWPERRSYFGKINHVGAARLIQDILTDEPRTSFHFVLRRIIEKIQEENHVLAFKDDATVQHLAWAVRNIMEVRVISRFICQSKANLDRFVNDVLTTGTAILQANSGL